MVYITRFILLWLIWGLCSPTYNWGVPPCRAPPAGYHGLVTRGHLKPGEWLLVTGAGGGMGSMALELGKAVGAKARRGGGCGGEYFYGS